METWNQLMQFAFHSSNGSLLPEVLAKPSHELDTAFQQTTDYKISEFAKRLTSMQEFQSYHLHLPHPFLVPYNPALPLLFNESIQVVPIHVFVGILAGSVQAAGHVLVLAPWLAVHIVGLVITPSKSTAQTL